MPVPVALMATLRQNLPGALPPVKAGEAEALSDAPGCYLLLLRLDGTLALGGGLAGRSMEPGWYAYVGSARGPGGLRARLARHLRREKRVRWHVDQLSMAATEMLALPFPDSRDDDGGMSDLTECALAKILLASSAFTCPLPGFGSSDCAICESHLLLWRPDGDA